MCWCKGFLKRVLSFVLAIMLGLFVVAIWKKSSSGNNQPNINLADKVIYSNGGSGSSGADFGLDDSRNFQDQTLKNSKTESLKPLWIISKTSANYTDEARINLTEGRVLLRVTFLANGQIGAISVVSGLPNGLTEEAINAAKKIKFKPALRGGIPVTVTKAVEYTFTIY